MFAYDDLSVFSFESRNSFEAVAFGIEESFLSLMSNVNDRYVNEPRFFQQRGNHLYGRPNSRQGQDAVLVFALSIDDNENGICPGHVGPSSSHDFKKRSIILCMRHCAPSDE